MSISAYEKGRIITPPDDRLDVVLGAGGRGKADSSSRINAALGIR
jgi:hypothetical protein